MRLTWIIFVLLALTLSPTPGAPIPEETINTNMANEPPTHSIVNYVRYLNEVSSVLEKDPEFRDKIVESINKDLKEHNVAQELESLDIHLRHKLDEAKRREIERLRELANKEYELTNDIDREHLKIPEHLDHSNEHTFEVKDLEMLMKKSLSDIKKINEQRKVMFKEYVMQKELEKRMEMQNMTKEEQEYFLKEIQMREERKERQRERRGRVHHPGSKAHFMEIWEKQDQMDKEYFNPRIFFMLHDLDGNNFWDEIEVKALFIRELDKIYPPEYQTERDKRERAEEMENMNEHLFNQTDANEDGLISLAEFQDLAKQRNFNMDYNWEAIGDHPQFTENELKEFQRQNREELKKLIAAGLFHDVPKQVLEQIPESNEVEVNEERAHANEKFVIKLSKQDIEEAFTRHQQSGEKPIVLNSKQMYKTEGHQQQQTIEENPIELSPSQIYTLVKPQLPKNAKEVVIKISENK